MACIILYKGEEIPYEEWVGRLENGLLDELISNGSIDVNLFKGEAQKAIAPEIKEEVKVEEQTPQIPTQPTSQCEVKNKLIELGISEEEAEVTSRIYDAYVRNKAAKTGRAIEDVYKDIEFEKEFEEEGLNQIIGEQGASRLENAEMVLADLNVAREMEKAGKSEKDIWMATNWQRGKDGKWRFEIAPINIDITTEELEQAIPSGMKSIELGQLVKNDDLFKAYPQLKTIKVEIYNDKRFNIIAAYVPKTNELLINLAKIEGKDGNRGSMYSFSSNISHEIQHAIQHQEGFAVGGGSKEGKEIIKKDYLSYLKENKLADTTREFIRYLKSKYGNEWKQYAYKGYKRIAGEVESFNVQTRFEMSEVERKAKMLSETEDVSREQQIVLRNGLQQNAKTPKGRITFKELKSIMAIGKDGDASTFIHELSHHDLQGYIDLARKGDVDAINSIKAVVRSTYPKSSEAEINKKLAEVLSVERTQENVSGTEYEKIHEHYARGFEKWMKDGDKAGFSDEMVALFEKMKEFLIRIYEGIKLSPIDVQFSKEVEQMYKDMFGNEYNEVKEQLQETKQKIEEDTTNDILDEKNIDDLFGDLSGGLKQEPKKSYTPRELLLAKAEQLFRNYETDEFNVIDDLKTFVDGLPITDQSKELYKEEIDKNAKELESKIAYDKEVRMIAEKILSSKETSPEMKKAARKNATYNTMQLRGEMNKAEKEVKRAESEEGLKKFAEALAGIVLSKDYQPNQGDVALTIQTLQRVNAKYQRAKADKDTKTIAELQSVHDKLVEAVMVLGTKAGQRLNEFKLMKYLIPDMYATSLKNLRERGMTATERKEIEKKMQDLADKLAKFQESESWATEQLISAEEKIEKQKELIREIQKEKEQLREAKKFVEKEESKPSEKAEGNTKTNEQFAPKVQRKHVSLEDAKARLEAFKAKMKGKGLQQAMLSEEAELREIMLELVDATLQSGKKVKIASFVKDFEGTAEIEDLIDSYKAVKNSLILEYNEKNFSSDAEIEKYKQNKLDSAKLEDLEKKEEMTQDQLEILEYEKVVNRVNKLKKKIAENDLETKSTPKVNSERIASLKKEEAKLRKELDDLRKEAKVGRWSEGDIKEKQDVLSKKTPEVVAKRILGEAERRNSLRTPKQQDELRRLKEILFRRAVDRFKEKPFKEKQQKTIEEKLADYLNEELLKHGKDWDADIKSEINSMIDKAKYSEEDKANLKEYISDYLNSRTETLLTNAVSDSVIKEILERGFTTKDGKVDWRTILRKNNKNYAEAKQFLKDELAFEIGSDKLANDVIDAIEKRFEKDSNDRKQRFLESEINKALKKDENSKVTRKMNTMLKKLIELSNIGGLDKDVFFKYFAKDFGFETFNQLEMDRITDYLNKIQALPEGEEKNRMIQELSAYVKIAESEGAFAWETFMAFMYKNMLGHPFTALVNATSIPAVLAKAGMRSLWDINNWRIAKDAMFQKAELKTALSHGYKKGGMKFEESGTDKTLPQFDAVEQAFKLADEIESKIQRQIAKKFAGAAKYSGLLHLGRFMEGTDSMTRNPAEEMRAYKALKTEIEAEYKARGESVFANRKAIREEAMKKLYPITNEEAKKLAFNEFVTFGVQPTPAQVQRRAFEMQQQMRSDDVRRLAEEEGLRETHRSKPRDIEDFTHGSAGLVDLVRLAIEGATKALSTKMDSKDKNVKIKMAQAFVKATQMPFVGIVMNILEKGLELNPYYGGAKFIKNMAIYKFGIKGDKGVLTEKERKDQQFRDALYNIARVVTGLMLAYVLSSLGAFDDDEEDVVEIYGNNPQGKANLQSGQTLPKNVVSFKLPNGGRFNIPIGYFSVWSPELSIKAVEQDMRRQEKFKATNLYTAIDGVQEEQKMAIRQYIETIAKGLPTSAPVHTYEMVEKTLDGDSNGAMMGAYLGNLVTTMILPDARMLKDIYAQIDQKTYEATTFKEGFMTSAGFMFNKFYDTRPMYDYRGRLIDIRDRRPSSISGIIRSAEKNVDDIDKIMTKNNVLIIPTNQNKVTDKYQKVDASGLLIPLTPEENYTNYLEINTKFDSMLKDKTLNEDGYSKAGSMDKYLKLKEADIKKYTSDGLPISVAEKKAAIQFKKNVQEEYKALEEKMLNEKGIKKVDSKMRERDFIERLKF